MPLVKVNGIAVEVPPGTNMIEAAKKVGVEIPHYCYHQIGRASCRERV